MVLEAIPKTAGARPPTFGGPPIGTTFSNEPDDRDSMLVHLQDNVQRLVFEARNSPRAEISKFMRLLDQRRDWIKNELDVIGMLSAAPKAPLGIPENIYDLANLSRDPSADERRPYERMLEVIDRTMALLWERMTTAEES